MFHPVEKQHSEEMFGLYLELLMINIRGLTMGGRQLKRKGEKVIASKELQGQATIKR